MTILSFHERLQIVSEMASKRKDLKDSLEQYRDILKIQQAIDAALSREKNAKFKKEIITSLQGKTLETKKPIINYIETSEFNPKTLLPHLKKTIKVFMDRKADSQSLSKFLNLLDNGKVDTLKLVEMTLREDADSVSHQADELGMSRALLLHIIGAVIQPHLEKIAEQIDPSFFEKWWQPFCPVCGRTPIVARVRKSKRHLVCSFCGAEYPSDYNVCVTCGNRDPYTLKYMVAEGHPEFQIEYCAKCKHYLKTIVDEELKKPIPRGLEDILTLDLDLVAKRAGLTRD